MMEKLKALCHRHRETVAYLIAGGLTSLVNVVVYLLFSRLLSELPLRATLSTAIAWVVSVAFAYWVNRVWVFRSQVRELGGILRELGGFVAARVATGLLDMAIMYLAVDWMGWNDLLVKLASSVLVIVLNYVFSKLFVFRKGEE